MSMLDHPTRLPAAMEGKLRSIRRRQILLTLLRGLGVGACALVAGMIVAMSIDWLAILFDTRLRTLLSVGCLLLAAAALVLATVPALIRVVRWMHAAGDADGVVPELEERWTTVASFAQSRHQPETAAGRAMLQQVTSEASAMERLVDPRRVARPAALKRVGLTLMACLLGLAGFFAINWPQTSVLLARFWSPQTDITATQLICQSGDITVPRGEQLELRSTQTGIQRAAAALEFEYGPEVSDTLELVPSQEDPSLFVHSLRADMSFRYRMRAGDGQTSWHAVEVVEYPALDQVRLTIMAPDYVDRPPYEKQLLPGRVKVVQGSRLNLQLKPVSQLEQLQLALKTGQEEGEPITRSVTLSPDPDGWYRYRMQLLSDMSLRPVLRNEHGLTNQDSATCRIQVVADKPPVARVVSSTDEMAVAVDDVIDIQFEAHDDFGIATAELVIYDETTAKEGEPPRVLSVQPIPLGDQQMQQHVMGSTQLDLKELGLAEGTQISYAVRVTDNRAVPIGEAHTQLALSGSMPQEAASHDGSDSGRNGASEPGRSNSPRQAADRPAGTGAHSEPGDLDRMLADAGDVNLPATRAATSEENAGEAAEQGASASSPLAGKSNPELNSSDARAGSEGAKDPSAKGTSEAGETSTKSPAEIAATEKEKETEEDARPAADVEPRQIASDASTDGTPQTATAATGSDKEMSDPARAATSQPRDEVGQTTDPDSAPSPRPLETGAAGGEPSDEDRGAQQDAAAERAVAARSGTPADAAADADDALSPVEMSEQSTADREDSENAEESPTIASETAPDERNSPRPDGNQPAADEESEPQIASDSDVAAVGAASRSPRNPSDAPTRGSDEVAPPPPVAMTAQQSENGQNTETTRRTLRITARLAAVAAASEDRNTQTMQRRERVEAIDRLLAEVEMGLTSVLERRIPDADHNEQYRRADGQLGDVESAISELRDETRDGEYAFVGLQMVDIGRTHVTPARDRIFTAVRDAAGARRSATDALQHVVRARELLDDLLKRYDRVARDQQLAETLEETVEMYEVYVEKRHQLMREARQNRNPLPRKMAVIEVDQEYLDRYAEVLTLRREMLAEFARMLADDPRLLARYLDQLKRRRSSLRDQLGELSERQYEQATELSGWLAVSEVQRENLWRLIAELRLQATVDLAGDAAELAERLEKQLPLILDPSTGVAAQVLQHAGEIARTARDISFEARGMMQDESAAAVERSQSDSADLLVHQFAELDAALDQMNFEHEADVDVTSYVTTRLLESRAVADQADLWARMSRSLQQQHYAGLAEVDQQTTAIATELLRVEMLDFEGDLQTQFQQVAEADVPGEIVDLVRQLHQVMENITWDQTAATFALNRDAVEPAQRRQAAAVAGFDEAEKLFDRIRRAVIADLDQYEQDDPNIADLDDPTLDEFLSRLEREPNIQAQLGIPNRPRNLRVIADTMTTVIPGGDFLGDSESAARRRAAEAMTMRRPEQDLPPPGEMTDDERQQREQAQQIQQQLEQSLAALTEKMEDPDTNEQRRRLEQMAENIQRMLQQMGETGNDAQAWRRIVESDQARAVLKALASGEAIPDQQWNKILSTLDDGLWQVRGRTPPEEYRRAIEQYQDRIRELMNTITGEAG